MSELIDPTVIADLAEEPIRAGDVYLLCSDGLTEMVEDEQIAATLEEHRGNLQAAAESLISQANENGGRDNVSVILARTSDPISRGKSWYSKLFDWF